VGHPDQIDLVLDRFNSMLVADGASLSRESLAGGVLTVRYAGAAGDVGCSECVLDPDDLRELIGEALAGRVEGVVEVRLER
jgi:Fe-S cluster biogenesis protein NfuA